MRLSFSRVLSAAMCGMEVIPVQVEADVSNGLPLFHMVGYLGAEVREAEERPYGNPECLCCFATQTNGD